MPTPITFGAISARAFGFLGKLRAITDAYFKYVTLLLHGNGTNGAQNNTFLDGSTNAFTITRNGNTTQGSFSPFSQTGWSNYFDGNGDFLTVPSNAAFQFGTGDFTIECWINKPAAANGPIVDARGAAVASPYAFYVDASNFPYFYDGASYTSTVAIINNQWNHVAVVRTSSTLKIFVNGVEGYSNTVTTSLSPSATVYIGGQNFSTSVYTTGYISNLRIVKGTAVYTSNFTPPTAPLTAITNTSLLTCQSNRFIDNSSNAFAITRNGDVRVEAFSPFNPSTTYSTANVGGSGYFDGSGDTLSFARNAAFDFGTGSFTIEGWINVASIDATYRCIFSFGNPVQIYARSGTIEVYFNDSDDTVSYIVNGQTGPASSISANTWAHFAVVRNGTTFTTYVNGVGGTAATGVSAAVFYSATAPLVGAAPATVLPFTGYITDLRIVKGTAVYTANFTPPTAPLTAIANTSLLLNFNNGGIFDNASQTVLETVGNAQISTAQSKFGGGSMYFDGTGDWLTAPDRPAQRFGTADFTVEGWLYLAATGAARGLISKGTASTGWSVNVTSGNKLQFSYTASNLTGTSSLSASTWYYFTAMRTGGSIRVYLNGVQEVTNSTAITDNFNQTNILYVGADRVGGSALNGYIDDIRITNGYARYNNFTVPSAALTPTAYTAALPNTSTTNGAQNNTFLDGSTNNFTITRNGNTTQGTFSPFSNSGWSNYFDGTGDYLSAAGNTAFDFGTGDFTVEAWVYLPATQTQFAAIVCQASTGNAWYLSFGTGNTVTFSNYTTTYITSSSAVSNNTWSHVAVSRSGTSLKMFINGAEVGSATNSVSLGVTANLFVGFNNATHYFNGYLSNLRIVKGTAVYTSNFTPPTAPLTAITNTSLLTCQSNRFIDNSTNNFTITRNGDVSVQAFSPFTPAAYSSSTNGGSGYFDGTGDFLDVADNTAFDFGSGDFTVEAFVYLSSLPASNARYNIFGQWGPNPGANDLAYIGQLFNDAGTMKITLDWSTNGTTTTGVAIAASVVATAWLHIAWVRNGTSLKIFLNGTEVTSGNTISGTLWNSSRPLNIGRNEASGGNILNGYLSNLRIVKGTAVYTANFTPPTAPLTAIANTSLLLNFTNAGIFDAVGINNYETVGNAQASTTQAKFGTTSMYFDGTGDWLTAPDRPVNQLRAGDFTVEGWFYLSAINVAYGIVSKGTSTTGWSVNITSGNKLQFSYTSSNLTGATTLAASTWYHFAVVRSGGTVQIYLNGVQDAISSSAITTDFNQTNILYIGADRVGGSAMNGYLDDIRITPGQALYPGNFTAPTAPFPNN